jgi:circadian clock protein KaiB
MLKVRLYVTGLTPTAESLIDNLRKSLDAEYGEGYHFEVRDVFEHPTEAMDDGVMVTPTLMRLLPTPVRRLIGDLGNQERVLAGLRVEVDD